MTTNINQGNGEVSFQDIVRSLGGTKAKAALGMLPPFNEDAFRADIKIIKARLKAETHGLFMPRGKFIQYWDLMTGTALMYTLVSPIFCSLATLRASCRLERDINVASPYEVAH